MVAMTTGAKSMIGSILMKSPTIAETRNRIGDWEGDTAIVHPDGKYVDLLTQAAIEHLQAYNNDLEFPQHAKIRAGLGVDIYIAHLYCSWKRDK
jgi:IS30 family transposase